MNIELQCCGLAMLIVVLLIILRERKLELSSRRLFFTALLSCIVCVVLDIDSILAINAAETGVLPPIAARVICKLYLISLVSQGYFSFLYAAEEYFLGNPRLRLRRLYRIFFVLGNLLILLLPIHYYLEGRVVYSYGPAALATYVLALLFILSTTVTALFLTGQTSRRRRWALLLWQGVWILAAALQFLIPELLLVGFAASFGMVLIFCELENPHEGIDRDSGQFNANALSTYVGDLYRHGIPFGTMMILVDYNMDHVEPETSKTAMLRISQFLDTYGGFSAFRRSDDSYVLVFRELKNVTPTYLDIAKHIDAAVDMPLDLSYRLMPDSRVFESADEYFRAHYYCEKQAEGQECYIVDQQAVEGMRSYNQVSDLITSALAEHRVEVFYQPIYHVERGYFTAAEALVRIRDSEGKLVPPGAFIPVAEDNGLIVPLGIEIFRQVCQFLSSGEPQARGLEYIEVNLSVAQFDQENPADFVQRIMSGYNVDSKWINLEITETASSSAKQVLLKNMNKLIQKGVRFSLDDFGTGRSNLDYFVEMPVDIIKFDYSFIQGYFKTIKARYVVESMVELMNKMGLPIVAEGVETQEQLDAMCQLGVSYVQGFYFSRPVPREEFLAFLDENNTAAS
jgi:EAL domain-containing protein (putative c-di-GMP-specific phosphodiesterase class I)